MQKMIDLENRLHEVGITDAQIVSMVLSMKEKHSDRWVSGLVGELNILGAMGIDIPDIIALKPESGRLSVIVISSQPILRDLMVLLGLWPEADIAGKNVMIQEIPPRVRFKTRRTIEGLYCACCGKRIGIQPGGRRIRPGTRTIEGFPICANCYGQAPGCDINNPYCSKHKTALLVIAHYSGDHIYYSGLCPDCRQGRMRK